MTIPRKTAYSRVVMPDGSTRHRQVVEGDEHGHPLRIYPLTEELPFVEWRDETYRVHAPQVSVFIPVYNGGKYIAKTLDSVLRQTYSNWELIVLDDGSTDDSLNIIERYAKGCDKLVVLHQENDGKGNVARSLSCMYPCAHGEYGFYMSQDDTIDSDCLEKLVGRAVETGADVVLPNMLLTYEDGSTDTWKCSYPPGGDHGLVLTGKDAFYLSTDFSINGFAMVRLSLMRDANAVTTCYDSDEYNTRMQYLHAGNVAFADTNFYYYQGNPEAVTRKFSMARFQRLRTGIMLYDSFKEVFPEKDKALVLMVELMHFYIDTTILLYRHAEEIDEAGMADVKALFSEFEHHVSFAGYRRKVLVRLKNNYERAFAIAYYLTGSTLRTMKFYNLLHRLRKS